MKGFSQAVLICIATLSLGLDGCHHAAKMPQPAMPETKSAAPAEVQKAKTPPPVEEFKPLDIDAEALQALQTVYFDFDKYDLRSDAIASLGVAAAFLQNHPSYRVLAAGNCDERGSEQYNMGLGWNRAKAVKKYMTSYGISAARIETTSYGKERLARTGCGSDDVCNQANRRVEWTVLSK